eukprot:1159626-Pelagomonas_calceolata.AAC.8
MGKHWARTEVLKECGRRPNAQLSPSQHAQTGSLAGFPICWHTAYDYKYWGAHRKWEAKRVPAHDAHEDYGLQLQELMWLPVSILYLNAFADSHVLLLAAHAVSCPTQDPC